MEELKKINAKYYSLYSFFRSKASYDVLKKHLEKLDSDFTNPYTHIQNLLLQDVFLSWCKVFGSKSEECHWTKLILNTNHFRTKLYSGLNISPEEYLSYWNAIIAFRNKWVVHYDPFFKHDPVPYLDIAVKSASILFDYITSTNELQYEYKGPESIEEYIENVKNDFEKQLKI